MFLSLTDSADNKVTVNTDYIVTMRPSTYDENVTTLFFLTGTLINVQHKYEELNAMLCQPTT